jgi:hypothetical protein
MLFSNDELEEEVFKILISSEKSSYFPLEVLDENFVFY